MGNSITLHRATDTFNRTIQEVAEKFRINSSFIEKDYWISLVLKNLAKSKYSESVVFKGGTSLSKGYKLIDRFSEDIDIAIINGSSMSGNQIKTTIRNIEKYIASDLTETNTPGVTSKGSRFRKSVYSFPTINDAKTNQQIANHLIIEINSFANPFPFEKVKIQCMIGEYLESENATDLVSKYGLESFELNVLDKKRTLLEKIVSLIRFSFDGNPIQSISGKIRHFYDIYYLLNDEDCKNYFTSPKFKSDLFELIEHDKKAFDDPKGWKDKTIQESPLVTGFKSMWDKLKVVYKDELSMLVFSELPDERKVFDGFEKNLGLIIQY